ncbi:hypothetical protein ARMGADRAFT_1066725 [Armillaria gallica]|uniref:Uncharacterized protein n=1 Tax=Armillaria gallica TaxID=47427 RepID=A0A2H3D408_ARMGA|nr:hypothetical protein ARMGADRAFT_1066725 [Armillaria gallica]
MPRRRPSTTGRPTSAPTSTTWATTSTTTASKSSSPAQHHRRISTHSFGWVDGAIATSISILICSQGDNPWASELNQLELYSLSSFPLILTSKVSSRRRAVRCTGIILGKQATAAWICPHDCAMVSHWEEHGGCETLIAAVFPSLLNPTTELRVREVCMNDLNKWTTLDYDEDLGKIALGSAFGKVTIVQL